jgi:hypothetical protein
MIRVISLLLSLLFSINLDARCLCNMPTNLDMFKPETYMVQSQSAAKPALVVEQAEKIVVHEITPASHQSPAPIIQVTVPTTSSASTEKITEHTQPTVALAVSEQAEPAKKSGPQHYLRNYTLGVLGAILLGLLCYIAGKGNKEIIREGIPSPVDTSESESIGSATPNYASDDDDIDPPTRNPQDHDTECYEQPDLSTAQAVFERAQKDRAAASAAYTKEMQAKEQSIQQAGAANPEHYAVPQPPPHRPWGYRENKTRAAPIIMRHTYSAQPAATTAAAAGSSNTDSKHSS